MKKKDVTYIMGAVIGGLLAMPLLLYLFEIDVLGWVEEGHVSVHFITPKHENVCIEQLTREKTDDMVGWCYKNCEKLEGSIPHQSKNWMVRDAVEWYLSYWCDETESFCYMESSYLICASKPDAWVCEDHIDELWGMYLDDECSVCEELKLGDKPTVTYNETYCNINIKYDKTLKIR